MGLTGPQKKFLTESEYDTPKIIDFKIEQALEKARELEGWDVFATDRLGNLKHLGEDLRTVAARFWEKETAFAWVQAADPDLHSVRKWNDERFNMPCFLAVLKFKYPHYDEVKAKFDALRRIEDEGGYADYPDDDYFNDLLAEADVRLRAGRRYDQDYDQIEATKRASTRAGHTAPDFRDVGGFRPGSQGFTPYSYMFEWPKRVYISITKVDQSKWTGAQGSGTYPGPRGLISGPTSGTGLYHAPWMITIWRMTPEDKAPPADLPERDRLRPMTANEYADYGYVTRSQAQNMFNYYWEKYGPPAGI